MKYLIPENVDIDLLVKNGATAGVDPFKVNHLLYIIHIISSIPAQNKSIKNQDGFVPVHAQTLQRKVRNYNQYLKYLVDTGVLVVNRQYVPGKKSKGYKFAEKYNSPLTMFQYGKTLTPKSGTRKKLSAEQQRKYGHLVKWFSPEFTIDQQLSRCYIEWELKVNSTRNYKDRKTYVQQYNRSLASVENFSHRGAIFPTIDDFGYRFHSPLTNLKSELRNFLKYNGLNLVSIDINNSQPYMSTLLFHPSFWETSQSTDVLTHNKIGVNIEDVFNSRRVYDSFIMLCKKANNNKMSDLHRYIGLVREGTFYEGVAKYTGSEEISRKEIKAAVFQTLFTHNRFIAQAEAANKRLFKHHFPDVYDLFSRLKVKDKRTLPKLLQRIESHKILLGITKHIAQEQPNLPIFTIHDSIVTIEGSEAYLMETMTAQLTRTFGFPPKLTVSHWNPGNVKMSDDEWFNRTLCRA
ncbi:MAG: hypothetical protein ACOYVG_08985 [Bacteroidota bacterium]